MGVETPTNGAFGGLCERDPGTLDRDIRDGKGIERTAITGRVIADRVAGSPPPFDLEPFRADRF